MTKALARVNEHQRFRYQFIVRASERDGQCSRFRGATAAVSLARRAVIATVLFLALAVLEANSVRHVFVHPQTLLPRLQQYTHNTHSVICTVIQRLIHSLIHSFVHSYN